MNKDRRIGFVGTCPHGHYGDTFSYKRAKLEKEVAEGKVGLHCSTCKEDYYASENQLENMRGLLTSS